MPNPSRAILLTPPGAAAIAVLRLTGPLVPPFLSAHTPRPIPLNRCTHTTLLDGDTTIDDPVIVRPTDDTVDLNLHGGPWVVQAALTLAERFGFTLTPSASPLPDEAVDADTPRQRDVLQHLPCARTELTLRELLAQEQLWLTFDALPLDDRRRLARDILPDPSLHHLLNPPRVAIVGPANAGKSTLANRLFAQERSITADLPGTTRDWVGEQANIDGLVVTLLDTPGLRPSDDPIEQAAIARAAPEIAAADLVLLILDAARPLDDQRDLLDHFPAALRFANKADVATWDPTTINATPITARRDDGVAPVRTAILQYFHITARPGQQKWWTPAQRAELERLT